MRTGETFVALFENGFVFSFGLIRNWHKWLSDRVASEFEMGSFGNFYILGAVLSPLVRCPRIFLIGPDATGCDEADQTEMRKLKWEVFSLFYDFRCCRHFAFSISFTVLVIAWVSNLAA
jgi:hypothetical protein